MDIDSYIVVPKIIFLVIILFNAVMCSIILYYLFLGFAIRVWDKIHFYLIYRSIRRESERDTKRLNSLDRSK